MMKNEEDDSGKVFAFVVFFAFLWIFFGLIQGTEFSQKGGSFGGGFLISALPAAIVVAIMALAQENR